LLSGGKNMKTINMQIMDSDVLIIGSGIAGLRAALEVSKLGRRALLISKGPLGKANNTYLAGGLFAFGAESADIHAHIDKTLKSGRGLNNLKLVETFAKQAPTMVRELQEMGMRGKMHKTGLITRQSSLIGGPKITPPLIRACQESGVQYLDGIMVTDLVTQDQSCIGAIGFHRRTGAVFGFGSRAVVLATGGAGAIYSQNNNAPGSTGDGYALALEAGLDLVDMEFVQFYPLVRAKGGQARMIVPAVLADLGKITNRLGEDLKEKYELREKPIALASRDRLARALFQEISQGKGIDGAIHLDLREVKDAAIPFNKETIEILKRNLVYHLAPVKIAPACHHTMGGLGIDITGHTEIRGLFAAGEVVGGIHGANRMGGNALSESLVFGALAAQSALKYADSRPPSKHFQGEAEELARKTFARSLGENSKPITARPLMTKLGRILWEKAGILRDEKSLKESIDGIDGVLGELEGHGAGNPLDLFRVFECRNAALSARAIAVSALKRTESRGSHYRTDFPKENNAWLKHIYVRMSQGIPELSRIVSI
jgi:succinate dehydrogenase/fumarate reductase flavoprotein subunit